jgi:hypothetical protein
VSRKTKQRQFVLIDADSFDDLESGDTLVTAVSLANSRADAEVNLPEFVEDQNAAKVFIAEIVAIAVQEGLTVKEV